MGTVSKDWIKTALKTYDDPNWPADSPVSPKDLAEAGLYYTGRDDIVRCGYCGGRLQCWLEGDIPKESHEDRFPNCNYEGEPEFRQCMTSIYKPESEETGENKED